MAYLDSALRFRHPVTVRGDGTANIDVSITIPQDWDHFWDNVRADGFDVVLTAADGVTVLDFQRATWTPASRDGVLQVGGLSVAADADTDSCIWLYYGDPSAADRAGTPTIGSTEPQNISTR